MPTDKDYAAAEKIRDTVLERPLDAPEDNIRDISKIIADRVEEETKNLQAQVQELVKCVEKLNGFIRRSWPQGSIQDALCKESDILLTKYITKESER